MGLVLAVQPDSRARVSPGQGMPPWSSFIRVRGKRGYRGYRNRQHDPDPVVPPGIPAGDGAADPAVSCPATWSWTAGLPPESGLAFPGTAACDGDTIRATENRTRASPIMMIPVFTGRSSVSVHGSVTRRLVARVSPVHTLSTLPQINTQNSSGWSV